MKARLTTSVDPDIAIELRKRATDLRISVSALVQRSVLGFFRDSELSARPRRLRRADKEEGG
jgi:hypothetical protein